MTDGIRAAVVGAGFIGAAHAEALRRMGVDLACVVDADAARAAGRARALGTRACTAYEEVLADPDVDVVHLATPNHLHHAQARAALLAGKHVVCEKPLALTAAESADLVRIADERGLVNAVCFNVRFYPLCHQAAAMVAGGELGDVWLVQGSYHQDWLLFDTDWNWRLDPRYGGPLRAVADIGSHWLDLVQFVTGDRVEQVLADLTTFLPVRRHPDRAAATFGGAPAAGDAVEERITTEDAAGVLLRFAGGARGVLSLAQVVAGRKNRLAFEVAGSRAALAWHSERPEELWVGHRDRPNEVVMRDPGLLAPPAAAITGLPGGHPEGFPDAQRALFAAAYRAVALGRPPVAPDYPTFRDGHAAVVAGEAIARSAREGRWTTVAPVPDLAVTP